MQIKLNWLKKRLVVFMHDLCMIRVAWFDAYWLSFNLSKIPNTQLENSLIFLPILILVQIIAYQTFGLYRGVWRYASLPDLLRIMKAVGLGVLLIGLVLWLNHQLIHIPRSILPLYTLLLILLLGGSRFFYRLSKYKTEKEAKRVLIVGAGQAGEGI